MIQIGDIRSKVLDTVMSRRFIYLSTFIVALFGSLLITVIVAKRGPLIGTVLLGGLTGAGFLLVCLFNIRIGMLLIVLQSFSIFTLIRLRPDIPFGAITSITILVTFIGIFLQRKPKTKIIKSPVVIVLVIWLLYQLLQVFNPNSLSIQGWLVGLRGVFTGFLFVLVAIFAFSSRSFVILFTKFWLALAVFTAIYALKQEYFGLFEFEKVWVYSNPKVLGLSTVGGRFRRWSILADVSSFGMFMAFSGLVCFVLAFGPFSVKKKLVLLLSAGIIFFAMVFSFTRTAYAMVPVGLVLFFLMNVNNKKILAVSIVSFIAGVVLIFGPFYSGPLNRIRSTFRPTEDASYAVRENNRSLIQPYILENPIGGGPQSTGFPGERYHPGHTLAGFPPDNFYLRTALEYGWVGLFLFLTLYATIMVLGIRGFYQVRDPTIKILYAAYITCLFSLSIANFAQIAHGQPPLSFIVGSIYALMYRMKEFDYNPDK
ncbi:O-antigen ligase family protein [Tunicatimonas pelagia]|uniref:O-antigen ligase family protein n=1 Tax=Tunicatimonas pelagia TaxID=931531 RepID=UPI002665F90F|nr:O-antigen ligase family protein [Tunicatimonas pelagia]WKN42330.1 O-antigen ligase family protein [Tunicatimonas pelagia]